MFTGLTTEKKVYTINMATLIGYNKYAAISFQMFLIQDETMKFNIIM